MYPEIITKTIWKVRSWLYRRRCLQLNFVKGSFKSPEIAYLRRKWPNSPDPLNLVKSHFGVENGRCKRKSPEIGLLRRKWPI